MTVDLRCCLVFCAETVEFSTYTTPLAPFISGKTGFVRRLMTIDNNRGSIGKCLRSIFCVAMKSTIEPTPTAILAPNLTSAATQPPIAGAPLKPDSALWSVLLPVLPVLLVWLWAALQPQMTLAEADLRAFGAQTTGLFWQFLPLLIVQALLGWAHQQHLFVRQKAWLLLLWGAGMLGYPAIMVSCGLAPEMLWQHWLLAIGLSLLYWLHLRYQTKLLQGRRSHWQWLWSLDTVLGVLVLCWTLAWAFLLVSHPPGFAEQPIPVKFDWQRVWLFPGLFLSYLWQFSVLAATMWGFYWLNRYWLIRCILAQHGLWPFVLVSLTLILLCYPLLSALLLQLPMNQVAVPALPGGGPNPFDWYNLNFMVLEWLFTTPLILAFDRQQQESTLAQIKHQQIQTELQLLQQQINPHFLFNTLNNLYALCLTKSESAPQLILQLADVLRYVVYQGQQPRVSLQQDFDYLRHYLALQQLRVSHKTKLTLSFPEQCEQYQIPPLLLIMLVENAYKHGVENTLDAGWVRISAEIQHSRLYFYCENSCAPIKSANRGGMGLKNLRRRLQLYYGDNFVLRSEPTASGWRAELQLELALNPAPQAPLAKTPGQEATSL